MELLDNYLSAVDAVHQYFGYVEDWVVIPLDDGREYYWHIYGGEAHGGRLCYAKTERELETGSGDYYEAAIYTQRFLPRWVYRAKDFTLVSIDTQTDGNKFLIVLDNARERALVEPVASTDTEGSAKCPRCGSARVRVIYELFGAGPRNYCDDCKDLWGIQAAPSYLARAVTDRTTAGGRVSKGRNVL